MMPDPLSVLGITMWSWFYNCGAGWYNLVPQIEKWTLQGLEDHLTNVAWVSSKLSQSSPLQYVNQGCMFMYSKFQASAEDKKGKLQSSWRMFSFAIFILVKFGKSWGKIKVFQRWRNLIKPPQFICFLINLLIKWCWLSHFKNLIKKLTILKT